MSRRIRVRGVPRPEPDVRLYVLALIELARQLQAEEAETKSQEQTSNPSADAREEEAND